LKLELLNVSVVVLAQGHNPTILHPAFLESQGIVPPDWQLAEPPICTPPLSVVKFANGIVFSVESNKFQVVEERASPESPGSKASELAIKYIEKLPHVRYTAVGVNFNGFIAVDSPAEHLIERFLKPGNWNSEALKPQALGLRLSYAAAGGIVNLSCDPSRVRRTPAEPQRRGIAVRANYHSKVSDPERVRQTVAGISRCPECYQHFIQIVKTLFDIEG
jgi:hypothetical protein